MYEAYASYEASSILDTRYATSIVEKYLDTATVNMLFTKEDLSTSDEQVEKLTRKYNIHYRACIGSLIYQLSTRVDLSFAVHKLEIFSANPGKVHFEVLIHLFRYIRDIKTLGLKYYVYLNDALVTDLLRQANIKTKNHLMDFSDSSWKDFPDTGRSTGELFQPQMGQFTWWTSTKPIIGAHFMVHVLGSKRLF